MGRKKSKAAKIVDVITGNDEANEAPAPKPGLEWWAKMPVRDFKEAIKTLKYSELATLLVSVQAAVRAVTLKQYVEDMSLEDQKVAARRAPVYRGCCEAVMARMHAMPLDAR